MSFFQEDGVLTSRTSTGTDVVTLTGSGASLDVKLVRLVLNGATATGGADADYVMLTGYSDGTNNICAFVSSQDNVGTTVTGRAMHTDSVLSVYNNSGTLIDQGTISSIGNGTFTLNWTTKSATAYKIGWTTWGGTDIAGVEVGSFAGKDSSGSQDVSTVVKSASVAFFMNTFALTVDLNKRVAGDSHYSIGYCDSSLNQGVINTTSDHNQDTSSTWRRQTTDSVISVTQANSGALYSEADVTALDAVNGIQLNWSTFGGQETEVLYVLIKGGQWEVGSGLDADTGDGTGTKAFQPVGHVLVY